MLGWLEQDKRVNQWCGLGTGYSLFIFGHWYLVYIGNRLVSVVKIGLIFRNTLGSLEKNRLRKNGGISPFQAMSTALAGTMGVGNITGIATAMTLGGAGSIFWMWISAFFGMMTKYAEVPFGGTVPTKGSIRLLWRTNVLHGKRNRFQSAGYYFQLPVHRGFSRGRKYDPV